MILKKNTKPNPSTTPISGEADWRESLRQRLGRVSDVDAVFTCVESGTVHVYSVVEQFRDGYYKRLLKEEAAIEKAFPCIAFEFHTWVHQGREPAESGPTGAELVFLR